jgi:hypothetical protein
MRVTKRDPILKRESLRLRRIVLKVSALACVFVAVGVILYFAEHYLRSARSSEASPVVLVDVPSWVPSNLRAKVIASAGKNLKLDDNAARTVAQNLASVAWLDHVNVRVAPEGIRIEARWRKPLALIKTDQTSFYIDAGRVVLDFVEMPGLPVVTIKGVSACGGPKESAIGGFEPAIEPDIRRDLRRDLTAAMELLALLDRMDRDLVPHKPLLGLIDGVDVSNFNGRKNGSDPHIVLYTKDNTQIVWGAEIGAWARYLEAKDEDKLAKLYTYYKEHGTLSTEAKYINLRDPQDKIPQPIDKYPP